MAEFEVAELPLDNDWLVWYTFRKRSTTTSRLTGDDTLSVTAFLSLTDGQAATAIDPAVSVNLTAKGDGSGEYFGQITGANLTLKLASLVGETVYEIVKDGNRVRTARPLKVVETRSPAT